MSMPKYAIDIQRNGVWGEEAASQKIGHLGLMFRALVASPFGIVKGRGYNRLFQMDRDPTR